MRTTLTLDDGIARMLKEMAYTTGKSYKQIVNETLRAGMARGVQKKKRYKLKPVSLGKVQSDDQLVRALSLADQLEDEGIHRKLDMRK